MNCPDCKRSVKLVRLWLSNPWAKTDLWFCRKCEMVYYCKVLRKNIGVAGK